MSTRPSNACIHSFLRVWFTLLKVSSVMFKMHRWIFWVLPVCASCFCIHFVKRIPKGRNLTVLYLEASSLRKNVVTGVYMQHLHCCVCCMCYNPVLLKPAVYFKSSNIISTLLLLFLWRKWNWLLYVERCYTISDV